MDSTCRFDGCGARFDPALAGRPGYTGWHWPADARDDDVAVHDHIAVGAVRERRAYAWHLALIAVAATLLALAVIAAAARTRSTGRAAGAQCTAATDWWTHSQCAPAWFYRPYSSSHQFAAKGTTSS